MAQRARSQHGVLSRAQLGAHGISGSAISRWVATGRLHRVHPGVYALGHAAIPLEGALFAALLYSGNRAILSHTTAAWLWSLTEAKPRRVHVTVPGRRRSLPGVRVHRSRRVEATVCRGLPVTSVARTLLDIATVLPGPGLRRAIAEADSRGLLDPAEIRVVLGRGRPGSGALREAIESHLPKLAQTMSVLEERFLALCESSGIPLPEVNARVGRAVVDALWRKHHLVAELDGAAAHGGWAAIKRDRRRELALRSRGFLVVRYTWEQVTERTDEVVGDLRRLLAGSGRNR